MRSEDIYLHQAQMPIIDSCTAFDGDPDNVTLLSLWRNFGGSAFAVETLERFVPSCHCLVGICVRRTYPENHWTRLLTYPRQFDIFL